MAKLSVREAAKRFNVSRPTLVKRLKGGQLSGETTEGGGWLIDPAEMVRAGYVARPSAGKVSGETDSTLTTIAPPSPVNSAVDDSALQIRLARIEAELAAERDKTELLQRHIDDLRRMLPAPDAKPRRRWWQF